MESCKDKRRISPMRNVAKLRNILDAGAYERIKADRS